MTRRSCLVKYIGVNRTVRVTREDLKSLLQTEIDQSIEMSSEEGKLSSATIEKLQSITSDTGIGPIKIVCDMSSEYDELNFLEFLGFVGTQKVLLDANKSERYHGLLILGEYKIL